ncbi:MAG: hypothetical protein OXH69_17990 [Acidobacteria bacterium]|nr:hypothetical protein [Acidobacteriota bacterium]
MHDAVALEARGVPTAVIVTEAFLHEANVQRTALGAERLEPVVITHPLSTLTAEEIAGRGAEAAADARRILLASV